MMTIDKELAMGIQILQDRTNAYIGTFHYESANDMLQLEDVRSMVKNMNKLLKKDGYNYKFRVKLQGRGKNRFERAKEYYEKKYNGRLSAGTIKRLSAQNLPLECAEYVDAYVLRRR
jgi:Zn/Cd-binding protein ZinT